MKLIFGGKNIAYLRIVQTNRASSSLFLSSFALSFPLSISSLSKGEWPGTSRQGRRLNERGKERADESWSCLTPKRNTAIGLAKKVEKKFSSWRHVVQKLLFLKQYHTCLRCASRSVKFPMNARRRRATTATLFRSDAAGDILDLRFSRSTSRMHCQNQDKEQRAESDLVTYDDVLSSATRLSF